MGKSVNPFSLSQLRPREAKLKYSKEPRMSDSAVTLNRKVAEMDACPVLKQFVKSYTGWVEQVGSNEVRLLAKVCGNIKNTSSSSPEESQHRAYRIADWTMREILPLKCRDDGRFEEANKLVNALRIKDKETLNKAMPTVRALRYEKSQRYVIDPFKCMLNIEAAANSKQYMSMVEDAITAARDVSRLDDQKLLAGEAIRDLIVDLSRYDRLVQT